MSEEPFQPMTEEQHQFISVTLTKALKHLDCLTDFEAKFVREVSPRVIQYGTHTRVTKKQWHIVQQIRTKVDLAAAAKAKLDI